MALSISGREENICPQKFDPQMIESMNGGKGYHDNDNDTTTTMTTDISGGHMISVKHTKTER